MPIPHFIYSELALSRDTGLMLRTESDRGRQVKGLREIFLIRDLQNQGLSITAIARKVAGCKPFPDVSAKGKA